MRKQYLLLFIGVLTVLLLINNCGLLDGKKGASDRVDAVLKNIVAGSPDNRTARENTAMAKWWANKSRLTKMGEIEDASNGFDEWRKEVGIYPTIESYTIDEVVPTDNGFEVDCTIDGQELTIEVSKNGTDPLKWVTPSD